MAHSLICGSRFATATVVAAPEAVKTEAKIKVGSFCSPGASSKLLCTQGALVIPNDFGILSSMILTLLNQFQIDLL
jgi:hypothetical protein